MFKLYNQIQANPVSKVAFGDLTFGHLLSALYAGPVSHTTGIDNRGLHHTDKRYAIISGTKFVNGVPTASPTSIVKNVDYAHQAVKGRGQNAKKITTNQYIFNLLVRAVRAQILNPILRNTRWLAFGKMAERLRSVSLNNSRFMKMAINPINAVYFQQWVLNG